MWFSIKFSVYFQNTYPMVGNGLVIMINYDTFRAPYLKPLKGAENDTKRMKALWQDELGFDFILWKGKTKDVSAALTL